MKSSQSKVEFEVCDYSSQAFKDLLLKYCLATEHIIESRVHWSYLDSYFNDPDIAAKTIVVETNYIDRDYLADYSGYYVRCFTPYQRWCTRLHFFSAEFTSSDIDAILEGTKKSVSAEKLGRHYLGFLVLKPLPETIIGRTCLKTYKSSNGRNFPIIRNYAVNLFGMSLLVKSLAFQEQDTVTAACATSALWSAFQGTGKLFQHDIPSPLEITRAAMHRIPSLTRAFPAKDGLTDVQMAEAIREVGLDPVSLPAGSSELVKATAYAYLKGKIPVLLNSLVTDIGNATSPIMVGSSEVGGHSVALTGYRLNDSQLPIPSTIGAGTLLSSSHVDKLYAHDDQVGPFARLEFETSQVIVDAGGVQQSADWLSCRWGQRGKLYVPLRALIPLVTTVRISFHVIIAMVINFDLALELLRTNGWANFSDRVEWDIYLIASNDLKAEYLCEPNLSKESRRKALTRAFPKFVWRVTAILRKQKKIDFLFDSTDIEQGPLLIDIVYFDQAVFDGFLHASDVYSVDPNYPSERISPQGKIWEALHERFVAQNRP